MNANFIDPFLWSYFDKDDCVLIAASIVSYRDSIFLNANTEKLITIVPMNRALSLGEAINWVQQLHEFN